MSYRVYNILALKEKVSKDSEEININLINEISSLKLNRFINKK